MLERQRLDADRADFRDVSDRLEPARCPQRVEDGVAPPTGFPSMIMAMCEGSASKLILAGERLVGEPLGMFSRSWSSDMLYEKDTGPAAS